MKKNTILTIAGSALIIFSAVQFASAETRQRTQPRANSEFRNSEFRNSNAYAAPAYESAPEAYRYSGGGWSAPAGR